MERFRVVQIVAAFDEMETGDRFEEESDGDAEEAVLLGVALSSRTLRALSNAKK